MIDVSKYETEAVAADRSYKEATAAVEACERALDAAQKRAYTAGCVAEEAQDRLCAAHLVFSAQKAVKGLSPTMREMLVSDGAIGTRGTAKALYHRGLLREPEIDAYHTNLGYDVMDLLRGQTLSGVPDDMQPNKDKTHGA